MRGNLIIAMVLLLTTGFAQNYTACIDDFNQQQNFTLLVNDNQTNISVTTACQYGCDSGTQKCRTLDAGYGLITIIVIMFFIAAMFWISHFLKRKENEDEDVPKATLSLVFMLLGMTGLLGLFVYAGGMVAGFDSHFLEVGAGMMYSLSNIWILVLIVFPVIIMVFFLIRVVRDRMIDKRR